MDTSGIDPFNGYIGQESLIETIRQYLALQTLPNLFFVAMKGSGKSELARRIAHASNKQYEEIGCRQGMKLDSILYRLILSWDGGIVFFDELPLMPKSAQGSLRTLTEDGHFFDKDGNRFDFPNLTILAAGTDITKIDDDLVDRFHVMEFEPYSIDDLSLIGHGFSERFQIELDATVIQRLAVACQGSPRKLRHFIEHDAMAIKAVGGKLDAISVFQTARVCPDGMSPLERTVLFRMVEFLQNGINPTLSRLATALRMKERALIPSIENLQAFGYISVGLGPGGTRLTPEGIAKVKELRNPI